MSHADSNCLIGIVGYSPVLDCYPLGPLLMSALERRLEGQAGIVIENMTWGPMHIVQRFQDVDGPRPSRLILVGAASTSIEPGCVAAYRWRGGQLPVQDMQERIYEAVTGIVDIENTLAIGEHFAVWPSECYAVEADMPFNCFGTMVIADSQGRAGNAALSSELGFSPAAMIERICDLAVRLATADPGSNLDLQNKVATSLSRGASFAKTHIRQH